MYSPTQRLNRQEACEYLHDVHGVDCATSSLATYATRGGGPAYQKWANKPLYTVQALDEWVEEKLSPVVTSTAELKALERVA